MVYTFLVNCVLKKKKCQLKNKNKNLQFVFIRIKIGRKITINHHILGFEYVPSQIYANENLKSKQIWLNIIAHITILAFCSVNI